MLSTLELESETRRRRPIRITHWAGGVKAEPKLRLSLIMVSEAYMCGCTLPLQPSEPSANGRTGFTSQWERDSLQSRYSQIALMGPILCKTHSIFFFGVTTLLSTAKRGNCLSFPDDIVVGSLII